MKFVPIFLSIDRIIESPIKSMHGDNLLFKSGFMSEICSYIPFIDRIIESPIKSMQGDNLLFKSGFMSEICSYIPFNRSIYRVAYQVHAR